MEKKIKEYYLTKLEDKNIKPKDWDLNDRFYYIELLARGIDIQIEEMMGVDRNNNVKLSSECNYIPSALRG